MYKSKLLYKKRPITINPELAVVVGLNEAIVLQQVQYWCEHNEEAGKHFHDGHFWVYNTFPEWQKQFPWWCEKTVKTIFSKLENKNLLITANYNRLSMDRTKWYRVNHEALDALVAPPSGKNYPMDRADITRPIPESNQRINNGSFPPDAVEKERSSFVSNLDTSADIPGFIDWYFDYYQDTLNKPHPRISADQRGRAAATLSEFMEQNSVDIEGLQIMAAAFFQNVTDSDYNINHFATPGILKNRFYETLL